MMQHQSCECLLTVDPTYAEPRQRAKPRHIIDQTRDVLHRTGLVERVLDCDASRWETPAGMVVCTIYVEPFGCGLYINDQDGSEPLAKPRLFDERYFDIVNRDALRAIKPMLDDIVATAMAKPY